MPSHHIFVTSCSCASWYINVQCLVQATWNCTLNTSHIQSCIWEQYTGRKWKNEEKTEWAGARDRSYLFTSNDFQRRKKWGRVKRGEQESRFLHVWFPMADLWSTIDREAERAMVITFWKVRGNYFLQNKIHPDSHSVTSDLFKCLWSCCLAIKRSCLFMRQVEGSDIP